VDESDPEYILLIDDEAIVRLQLRDILESAGYSVLESGDGIKAIELFRQRQEEIVLVMLDLNMPGISGYEALAEMQILDADVNVIVLTGMLPKEELLPGIKAILRKPYQSKQLLSTVEATLNGEIQSDANAAD
jgi:hypothetical protein